MAAGLTGAGWACQRLRAVPAAGSGQSARRPRPRTRFAAIPPISHELKYTAPAWKAEVAWHLARLHARPDPAHPFGLVRSVYFDTPGLAAHAEKAHGDHLKRKVRIRWYGEEVPGRRAEIQAFLEIKHREGIGRYKERMRFAVDPAWLETAPLEDPGWVRLLRKLAAGHPGLIPHHLLPVVCISYARHRFVALERPARICVDAEIRGDRANRSVFACGSGVALPAVVCEIKDHGQAPLRIERDLFLAGFARRSFSKYGQCLDRIQQRGSLTWKT